MGREQYNRYKDFAAEECLLADGGMYCPRQECGSGFLLDAQDTRVICPHCKVTQSSLFYMTLFSFKRRVCVLVLITFSGVIL